MASDWPVLLDNAVGALFGRKYEEDTLSDFLAVTRIWGGCIEPGKLLPMELHSRHGQRSRSNDGKRKVVLNITNYGPLRRRYWLISVQSTMVQIWAL